jgi:hypothetical protein
MTLSLLSLIIGLSAASGSWSGPGSEFIAAKDAYSLNYPASARVTGMAGAFTAVADDIYASSVNDAGLGAQSRISAAYSRGEFTPSLDSSGRDLTTAFLGIALPLPLVKGSLAVTFQGAGVSVDSTDIGYAFKIAYGRTVAGGLSLGLGAKAVGTVMMTPAWVVPAFDLSALYQRDGWRAGFALANIGLFVSRAPGWSEDTLGVGLPDGLMPNVVRVGVARKRERVGHGLLVALDVTRKLPGLPNGQTFWWVSTGAEYAWRNSLFMRLGYLWDVERNTGRQGVSAGAGVKLDDLVSLDVAIANHEDSHLNEIRGSVTLALDPSRLRHRASAE